MKRWQRGLVLGVFVGVAGAVFALTPVGFWMELRLGLYSLFHIRGPLTPLAPVVVVGIDGRTGARLGLHELPREWPRSVHAQLLDSLVARGAAVIVFDMDFRQPRNEEADKAFAQAIARSGRVVLFSHLNGRLQPIEDSQGRERGKVWVESLETPLPAFTQAARATGPFPLPKLDAAVDQFWTFKSSAQDVPTMPAVALQLYLLPQMSSLVERLEKLTAESIPLDSQAPLSEQMLTLRRWVQARSDQPALLESADDDVLLQLYAGENVQLLNFYGPPGTVTTVPYQAVIRGQDPNLQPTDLDFSGKVVFVGYSDLYDPGQPDRFYTVFTGRDGVDLSGVEIAATAFANLFRNESIQVLDSLPTAAILLLTGGMLGVLAYNTPAAIGAPLCVLLCVLYGMLAQLVFNRVHVWWPLAIPFLVQLPLGLLLGLFGQYRFERRRALHISQAISWYVPEDVSRMLTATESGVGSANRVTYSTCLATDMAGFSTIAESMSPAELASFLNDYFEVLAQSLKEHDVAVTEFRADAIMCAWCGDKNDPAVREKPVRAALAASAAIARFNLQRGLAGGLRVGLADGEVFVGHAGGGGHFVYSIVGDCANTASRIEALNKHVGTRILTTASVVAGLDELLLRRIGNFRFVGKTGSIPVVEVLGVKTNANSGDQERCQQYDAARDLFEAGNWAQAAPRLERLLLEFSQDGPARFLYQRCRQYLAGEDVPESPSVIVMSTK